MINKLPQMILGIALTTSALSAKSVYIIENNIDKDKLTKGKLYCQKVTSSKIKKSIKKYKLKYTEDSITQMYPNIKKLSNANEYSYILEVKSENECDNLA